VQECRSPVSSQGTLTTGARSVVARVEIRRYTNFDDAVVCDYVVECSREIVGVFEIVGGRISEQRLADSWLIDQTTTLSTAVAPLRFVFSDVARLSRQNALVERSRIADRHVACRSDKRAARGFTK